MKKHLSAKRKIILFFLNFIMIINLLLMGISFNLKSIVADTLRDATVSKAISNKVIDIVKKNLNINTVTFNNIETAITESHYIEDITSKYIESIIEQLNNGSTHLTFNVEISTEISNLIESIINSFKDSTSSSLLNKVIDTFREEIINQAKKVETTLNDYITENTNKYTQKFDIYMKIYSVLTSTWFKGLLIAITIVLFILSIIDINVTTTLISFGSCSLLIGLAYISILFNFALNILHAISQRYLGTSINLSYGYFAKTGIIMIIVGICGIIVGIMTRKKS